MKIPHLSLVASYSDGRSRVEHPLDAVALETAYVWLRNLVPADAWFTVEEVA